ncbi:MAG: DUF1015 family protein [Defluviitaleaceae bacterium]|nr:DUF1015 family protein [Defluviitaleaceae bacterium]
MAIINNFNAIRPKNDLAEKVAALPFDVYTREEAREAAKGNPYSFLHVDKAEIDLPDDVPAGDARIYKNARLKLDAMINDNVFARDKNPCLYVYRLSAFGRTQTGIVCLADVSEYENGSIKRHELTRSEKEKDRTDHINACGAHTGPIFMTIRSDKQLKKIISKWTASHEPDCSFTAEDGVGHSVWVIDDTFKIAEIVLIFEKSVRALYIADGHHRTASACNAARIRREADAGSGVKGAYEKFLAVVFPHDELAIMDYNRLVKDLNGLSDDVFFAEIGRSFSIEKVNSPVRPEKKFEYGMYMRGSWYKLNYIADKPAGTVESLDVSVLQDKLLAPVLGIADPRTDNRIDFAGGVRGCGYLQERVDCGDMAVAFTMYPTSMDELLAVSDGGHIMPPKSTWFEPKLRSGLFIHKFE